MINQPTPAADRERQIDGCPHCGQPPRIFFNDSGDYKSEHCWRIECLNEKCIPAPMMEHKDKQIAITAWNTRAFPALSPDNAGLREEVAQAMHKRTWQGDMEISYGDARETFEMLADAALAVVRKHVGGGHG